MDEANQELNGHIAWEVINKVSTVDGTFDPDKSETSYCVSSVSN